MLSLLVLLAVGTPTLNRARTCEVHLAMTVDDVAQSDPADLTPTRQMADWWKARALEAGAPRYDGAALGERRAELDRLRAANPRDFMVGRGGCIDEALSAGAVPGMALVRPD